jgi:hypothetical protein
LLAGFLLSGKLPTPIRYRWSQRGYLREIPLLLLVLALVLGVLLPRLPPGGQKVALAVAAVPTVVCLFYMIVAPGWTPNASRGGRLRWRMALFLGCAAALVAGVATFIVR